MSLLEYEGYLIAKPSHPARQDEALRLLGLAAAEHPEPDGPWSYAALPVNVTSTARGRQILGPCGDAEHFSADDLLDLAMAQRFVCQTHKVPWHPPRYDELIAVERGLLEGGEIAGERYVSETNSGWILHQPGFDKDLSRLEMVHAVHVVTDRPEIAQVLGLPAGSWFHPDGSVGVDVRPA